MVAPTQKRREYKRMIMLARLTAAAMLVAVPALALGQDGGKAADETQPISRTEISTELDTDYSDLDADKDGKVTATEVNARLVKSAEAKVEALKKDRDAAFAKLDTNGDGTISRTEFDERAKLPTIKDPDAKPFLDQFDANKDGVLTPSEKTSAPKGR